MKKLWKMMHDYQEVNVAEKGITFTEEKFTELFDETVQAGIRHISDVNIATVRGGLIGATSMGLVSLGVYGINKFRKRKLKDGEKEVAVALGDIITPEFEEMLAGDKKMVKTVSKKNADELKELINAITENEKGVKH